jgi:acyl-CoA thioesterase-1
MTKLIVISAIFFMAIFFVSCKDSGQAADAVKKEGQKNDQIPSGKAVKTILFFGNSLTAGYGLEPAEAYPSLIQAKIDSMEMTYKVVNAGVSGETSAGGNARIDWILKQPIDVFVLELGANDGLRGIPVAETKKNLQSIIDKVKGKYPEAKLVLAVCKFRRIWDRNMRVISGTCSRISKEK